MASLMLNTLFPVSIQLAPPHERPHRKACNNCSTSLSTSPFKVVGDDEVLLLLEVGCVVPISLTRSDHDIRNPLLVASPAPMGLTKGRDKTGTLRV